MGKTDSVFVVTGGAGFIGSHLVDLLLSDASTREVRVVDDFSSGREEHLAHHSGDPRLVVYRRDLRDLDSILDCFGGAEFVYHLAANPDARFGIDNTRLDLELETIATYNVLEAMRRRGVRKILLSSSGTVYGDIGTEEAIESRGPLLPTSLYGSGKVASESLISGFCGTFGFSGVILRFGNIVGQRTTHGVIFDFIRRLAQDKKELRVLGNGYQAKPYVYVLDLVAALRQVGKLLTDFPSGKCEVYNVAPPGATSVRHIAGTLLKALGIADHTLVVYGETPFGWPGDVPQSRMDSGKIARECGFRLARGSDEAVEEAIRSIVAWLRTRPESNDGLRLPD